MSFLYFAYGSNLWPPHLRSRCPSARIVDTATLPGWSLRYDKPSTDGSAKLNIRRDPDGLVTGVIYEIEDDERGSLDTAEGGYQPVLVEIEGGPTLVYSYEGEVSDRRPLDWYLAMIQAGARSHGLDPTVYETPTMPDSKAPGVRPAEEGDIPALQSILSDGLVDNDGRYSIHPGDLAWWVYHDDPRFPDHFSLWIQGEGAFVVIETRDPREIVVFARPGVDRWGLIDWAQRRVDGKVEVGWIADADQEMVHWLGSRGYRQTYAFRRYEIDLTGDLPTSSPPQGWDLRALQGEQEADTRRAASHAAFESKMDPAIHLQRYLGLMRSPAYVRERDLVAVDSDGAVGAFMIWWGDSNGVAQIEPFGTHPDFHRQGIGRALIHHGLAEMKKAGMRLARVCTDDDRRPATEFYVASGFTDVGRLWWWEPASASPLQDI